MRHKYSCHWVLGFLILGGIAVAGDLNPTQLRKQYREQLTQPKKIPYPDSNPFSKEKAELGKTLFFDNRVSVSGAQSCVSCHHPGRGWVDGLPKSIGHQGKFMAKRSMTLYNLAWHELYFWDGRADTLEKQIQTAIKAPAALAFTTDELVNRLKTVPGYVESFSKVFPQDGITGDNVVKALATYVRGIVTSPGPFDQWLAGKDRAISKQAINGFKLFTGKAQCIACHSGWDYTDYGFHDTGLKDEDPGRGKHLPNVEAMQHAFKTPSLRNLFGRGPYMHDGSIPTLAGVINFYDEGGQVARPSRAEQMKPLHLTDTEKADLMEFLKSLQSQEKLTTIPVLPY